MTPLSEIEVDLPETGLGIESLLDFVRQHPSSDVVQLRSSLLEWVDEMRSYDIEVDEVWLQRVMDDFDNYSRLTPATIQGYRAHPIVTLRRKDDVMVS